MSLDSRRRDERFLAELDLVLSDLSGIVIDDKAQAHDLTPRGMRAETRIKLPEKSRVRFALSIDFDEKIRGEAVVVWTSKDQWGWYNSGMKIVRMSWNDSRKLTRYTTLPGYDFVALAKRAAIAAYWVVVVFGLEAALRSGHVRYTLLHLAPILPAVIVLGWSLSALLGRD